jgi:erythronate-4-phosphate dehydrogenase
VRILADAHIAAVTRAFSPMGELELFELTPRRDQLARADALFVRTTVRVDRALLEGTPVRWVGSASAGIDHIDAAELTRRGIDVFHAPGCNAAAVADYVMSVLAHYTAGNRRPFAGLTVGVVGCGEVGRRVRERCQALGCWVLANDPPRQRAGEAGLLSLEELIASADVLSLHVPLTTTGPFPTRDLIGSKALAKLKPGACLINAARGGVMDEAALRARLDRGPPLSVAIDCWCGEPDIDAGLVSAVAIATPHIAGYSQRGKLDATQQIHRQFAHRLGRRDTWTARPNGRRCSMTVTGDADDDLRTLIIRAYDVRADDARLREVLDGPEHDRARGFAALRNEYPLRIEFADTAVEVAQNAPVLCRSARAAGFNVM